MINEEQLLAALEYRYQEGCRLGTALIAVGICTDREIAQALAEQLEITYVDLHLTPPQPTAIALLSRETAIGYGVVPVRRFDRKLLVAVLDPLNVRVDEAIRNATDLQPMIAIAPESQIREALNQYYGSTTAEDSAEGRGEGDGDIADEGQLSVEKLTAASEEIGTIRVVNAIIADGVQKKASDIHIEPDGDSIRIRYRIDGRLYAAVVLPRRQLPSIVARLKILCGMDIAECRKPQDGGCRVRVRGQITELRASTLPSVWGESVVLRILGRDTAIQRLEALGFEPDMLLSLHRVLEERHGMLLVTGPTGSGKTTTLYAALTHLKNDALKIITVEDPVEAKLQGITQVQVHDRAGRSFSQALRSMLRQDPDVIMVGEIRDSETADIACRAALTGHLVLSTLHTRHSFGTIARLMDLGVPSYLLAAALNGVIAQRLARRICEGCAETYVPSVRLMQVFDSHFGRDVPRRFRRGAGCAECQYRGTQGRIGIYEALILDEEMRRLLSENRGIAAMKKHVELHGFRTMEEDAFLKACAGLIPPEEVVQLGLGVSAGVECAEPGTAAVTLDLPEVTQIPVHEVDAPPDALTLAAETLDRAA